MSSSQSQLKELINMKFSEYNYGDFYINTKLIHFGAFRQEHRRSEHDKHLDTKNNHTIQLLQCTTTKECFTINCSNDDFVQFIRYYNKHYANKEVTDLINYMKCIYIIWCEKDHTKYPVFEKKEIKIIPHLRYLGKRMDAHFLQCVKCDRLIVMNYGDVIFKSFMDYVNAHYNDTKIVTVYAMTMLSPCHTLDTTLFSMYQSSVKFLKCHTYLLKLETEWKKLKRSKEIKVIEPFRYLNVMGKQVLCCDTCGRILVSNYNKKTFKAFMNYVILGYNEDELRNNHDCQLYLTNQEDKWIKQLDGVI